MYQVGPLYLRIFYRTSPVRRIPVVAYLVAVIRLTAATRNRRHPTDEAINPTHQVVGADARTLYLVCTRSSNLNVVPSFSNWEAQFTVSGNTSMEDQPIAHSSSSSSVCPGAP